MYVCMSNTGNSSDEARLAAVLRFSRCLLAASSCLSLSEEEEEEYGGEREEGGDIESPSLRLQLQHRKEQLSRALKTFCDVISSWFIGSVRVQTAEEEEDEQQQQDQNQNQNRNQGRKRDGPSLLAGILVPAGKAGSGNDQFWAVPPPMVPLRSVNLTSDYSSKSCYHRYHASCIM